MNRSRRKRYVSVLRETIVDINAIISKVHKTNVDFAKGSIHQRIITDLDGARVSTRAAIHIMEEEDVRNTDATSTPSEHSD